MSRSNESPGARLTRMWGRLSGLPGGRWLFSRILGLMVPYSGTLGARVLRLDPGHVEIELRDRRSVRNHLRSVHAIALANLGELSTGLAVLGALPPTVRGILTGIEVTYIRKARGRLLAEARCAIPTVHEPTDYSAEAFIRDESGDEVAVVRARWRLGPVPGAPS